MLENGIFEDFPINLVSGANCFLKTGSSEPLSFVVTHYIYGIPLKVIAEATNGYAVHNSISLISRHPISLTAAR